VHIKDIYSILYSHYGPQNWWPGDSPFEVMVGAILTQNTNWKNVEKAISNLKPYLDPFILLNMDMDKLSSLVRPSGFYKLKAKRLKNFLSFFIDSYNGTIEKMKRTKLETLRREFLSVPGIGRETCDSILLYALSKPVFVVDAYTKRIGMRHNIFSKDATYEEIQKIFEERIEKDVHVYNEFHALLVRVGKENCRKKEPFCRTCPLKVLM
jgi:endonuclease-3 related protein